MLTLRVFPVSSAAMASGVEKALNFISGSISNEKNWPLAPEDMQLGI